MNVFTLLLICVVVVGLIGLGFWLRRLAAKARLANTSEPSDENRLQAAWLNQFSLGAWIAAFFIIVLGLVPGNLVKISNPLAPSDTPVGTVAPGLVQDGRGQLVHPAGADPEAAMRQEQERLEDALRRQGELLQKK